MQRCIFYQGLDDRYLQKELCNLKSDKLSLKQFFDEAIIAEAKRKTFEDTSEKSNSLDPSSAISINKYEYKVPYDSSAKRGKFQRGRGGYGAGRGATVAPPNPAWRENGNSNSRGRGGRDNFNFRPKKVPTCWTCNEVGHTNRTCPQLKENSGNKQEDSNKQKFQTSAKKITISDNEATVQSVDLSGFKAEIVTLDNPVTNKFENKKISGYAFARAASNRNRYCLQQQGKVSASAASVAAKAATVVSATFSEQNSILATIETPAIVSTVTNKSDGVKEQPVIINISKFKSNKNIMAGVVFNDVAPALLEVDTAACHNIISVQLFQDICELLDTKPVLEKCEVIMRLADGTPSDNVKGCVNLSIKLADAPNRTATLPVFVVEGPNCLLGRPALEKLFPEFYSSLMSITQRSVDALGDYFADQGISADAAATVGHESSVAAATAAAVGHDTSSATVDTLNDDTPPPRRTLPPPPTGNITQEMGEQHCRTICDTYPEVFDGGSGLFKGAWANMYVKPGHEEALMNVGVRPPAKVVYGLKDEMEPALDEMYKTLKPIDGRELFVASQVVPVVTVKEGVRKMRLCINYKNTINEHLQDEPHVYSTCNEQLDKLRGEFRTCVDLSGAFKQVPVPPGFSQKVLAVVTSRGYAVPTMMPFGVKTAPGIWNSNMNKLIHGMDGKSPIPSTACIVDDVCLTGASPQEHFDNLHELVYRLYAAGLKVNLAKCSFYQDEVKFLGKIINKDGISLDSSTTSAITNMPTPTDKNTLRSFLGHMSYIGRHVPDLRTARSPLDKLLKEDVKFIWTDDQDKAFNKCKKLASNPATLAHFDPQLPLVLTTDASPVGLGACLAHRVTENGKTFLKPLSYASCALKTS